MYTPGGKFHPYFDEPGSFVSAVDLLIMRDDGFYFDFNDSTFKDSAWTTKTQALTEKTEGVWVWATGWTIPSGPSPNRQYRAIYKDNAGTRYLGELILAMLPLNFPSFSVSGGGAVTVASLQSSATSQVKTQADQAINDYGPLRPSVSGRQLAVASAGHAGIDWANIGSPNSVVSLGGTTVRGSGMIITAVTDAVGSVTGNVGGNVVGSIGSVASSGIVVSSLAPSASNEIADRVLRRGLANVEHVSDARSLAWGVAKLVNKVGVSVNTLTVNKTDDVTSLFSQAVTTSGGALPIITVDTN